jgi:hypothetical protein
MVIDTAAKINQEFIVTMPGGNLVEIGSTELRQWCKDNGFDAYSLIKLADSQKERNYGNLKGLRCNYK